MNTADAIRRVISYLQNFMRNNERVAELSRDISAASGTSSQIDEDKKGQYQDFQTGTGFGATPDNYDVTDRIM